MDAQGRRSSIGGSGIDVVDLGRRSRLEALIRHQHGVVSHAQLLEAGVSRGQIERRRRSGRLIALHRGIYRVGLIAGVRAPEMAAVLACEPAAYISHDSALHLHGLPALGAKPNPVHVTVLGRNPRARRGILVHRVASLGDDETTVIDNIPVTTVARAILDLIPSLATSDLEHLVAEAYAGGMANRHQLARLAGRYPRRPGVPALSALLVGPARTRSRPERMLLTLLRKAGLPEPRVNQRLHGYEVDFLWPEHKVVVEFDGHAFHAARPKRERDSRRDQDLTLRGYVVLRVTWYQLTREPEALIARIATILAQRDPSSLRTAAQ
jgi:very-short-patch-repair endonuclease